MNTYTHQSQRHLVFLSLMLMISVILLTGLIYQLIHSEQQLIWDQKFNHAILSYQGSVLTTVFSMITLLGDKRLLGILLIALSVWFWIQREKCLAAYMIGLGVFAAGSIYFIKIMVNVARPDSLFYDDLLPAFPSGHTALSISVLGFLSYLISTQSKPQNNKVSQGILILMIALIICSRLYLGVHWFTDVVGGILLGLICLIIAILVYKYFRQDQKLTARILPVSMVIILIVWLFLYTPPLRTIGIAKIL